MVNGIDHQAKPIRAYDAYDHAAGGVVSILQSTIYINPVWDRLTPEEEDAIIQVWAIIIREHPDDAVDHIIHDIMQRPEISEAWVKLGKERQDCRRFIFRDAITVLLQKHGDHAKLDE